LGEQLSGDQRGASSASVESAYFPKNPETFRPAFTFLIQSSKRSVPVRKAIRLLAVAVLFAPLASGQSKKIEVTDLPGHPFNVDFPSGSQLTIHVRSGDVRVVGRDDNKVSVKVDAKDPERAKEVKVRFERFDNSAELDVSGGPKNDLRITIEIPKSTGLFVRMPAGQLELSDIRGDKDVQLHAGE
jgi:hypothetical protein